MTAYIYKDNELEKVITLDRHPTMHTKAKQQLKRILTSLTRLSERGESHYFVELKIDKDE